MLQIESERRGAISVIRLRGDVDEEGVKQLRIALVDCLKEQGHFVVLNLTNMKFISYMGVGVLVERLRQFRTYGGDMKLVGLNLYTQRLFRMTGITSLFETFESEDQALKHYLEAA